MKVLIVDDEKTTREGLRDQIDWKELGFTDVRCADDGLQGLETGRQFRPDVILADVRMPRLDGIRMSEQIQQLCPESAVIIMSGYSDKEYLKAAIRLRAVSYVEKPIDLDEITAALREASVRVANENMNRIYSKAVAAYELTLYPEQRGERTLDPSWFRTRIDSFSSAFTILIQSYCSSRMMTEEGERSINERLSSLFRKMSLERLYTLKSPLYIFQMFSRRELSGGQISFLGQRITEELRGILKSFHVVIGKQVKDYRDLHESYASAVITLQAAFFEPANVYLPNKELSGKVSFRALDESSYESLLKKHLADRDRKKLEDFPEDLLSDVLNVKDCYLPNQVRELYYRLHLVLSGAAISMQLDPSLIQDSGTVWNGVNACNTIYELDRMLTRSITVFCDAMETPSEESETVYHIKNYINRRYSDPALSIKEISTHVHLSTSYICTLFKKETGMTLNQYITVFRMARAIALLDDQRNRIVEIAGQVGYSDSNYFSKTFRKAFGMSPSEYREQNGTGETYETP